ncbi:MAG: hypothetical protein ACI9IP_003403, partial [Arcticibacterium sp.]
NFISTKIATLSQSERKMSHKQDMFVFMELTILLYE